MTVFLFSAHRKKEERNERRQSMKANEYRARMVRGRKKKREGFDRSMRLHYIRVVCGRNSRRQFRLNLILHRFRIKRSGAMKPEGRPVASLPCKSAIGPRGSELRLPTIVLKGRPFSGIYGFMLNFRLKFSASFRRCHSDFS